MATNASKAPLLRILSTRGYAAQAAPKAAGKASGIQTTTLPNKLIVATTESSLPISRVSIIFRAGSRNETSDNLGASHLLRLSDALTTKNSTKFAVARNLQQVGGSLSAFSDRELVGYTVETTVDKLETGIKFLEDVATGPTFKPWEISDSIPRLKVELAAVPDQVRAVELLHKAAFRTGLGNSIFCPDHQVGKLSTDTLLHYFCQNYRTNRCAVVGVGVDHNLLVGYAQNLDIETGDSKSVPSKYYGSGEIRCEQGGNLAHVALAGEGSSLANPKESLAFAVLQYAAGIGPSTKRGNTNGALGKVITSALSSTPFSFSTLNASYTDGGLFGFVLSTDAQQIAKGVEAGVKALKSGSITNDDVNRAKVQLKAAVLSQYNTDAELLADIGAQATLLGNVQSAEALVAAIDGITQSDVTQAAQKVARSKISLAAIGNLSQVPYISDLC